MRRGFLGALAKVQIPWTPGWGGGRETGKDGKAPCRGGIAREGRGNAGTEWGRECEPRPKDSLGLSAGLWVYGRECRFTCRPVVLRGRAPGQQQGHRPALPGPTSHLPTAHSCGWATAIWFDSPYRWGACPEGWSRGWASPPGPGQTCVLCPGHSPVPSGAGRRCGSRGPGSDRCCRQQPHVLPQGPELLASAKTALWKARRGLLWWDAPAPHAENDFSTFKGLQKKKRKRRKKKKMMRKEEEEEERGHQEEKHPWRGLQAEVLLPDPLRKRFADPWCRRGETVSVEKLQKVSRMHWWNLI